jgi:hypothetical protein
MNRDELTFRPPRRDVRACVALALLGGVALLLGLIFEPRAALEALLLASFALMCLSLAGAVLVALLYVTGAGWSAALRRVPEAMALALPVGAAGLAVVLLAAPALYPWAGAYHAEADATSPLRQLWLDWPFFLGRAAAYLACWYGFILVLVRSSRRQDADGDPAHTRRNVRLSAAFLVVFAVTFWLASYDWIMSLEPEWASTVFGLYTFAGLFLAGLAAVTLLLLGLGRTGPLRHALSADHLHDLGKLLFAFSTFWVYIWFCQYMLIWYVNNPEEATYFVRRQEGAWQPLLIADVVLNWVVPFVALLPRVAKRNPGVLTKVCVVLLVGRWLDLYLLIAPPSGQPTLQEVALQASLLLGGGGLFCLALFRALRGALLIPMNDPFLVESLHTDKAAHERSPERVPTGRAEEGGDGRIPQPARAVQAGRYR